MTEISELHWEVPAGGFRWVRGEPIHKGRQPARVAAAPRGLDPPVEPGWFLVPQRKSERKGGGKTYNPLNVEPPLFRPFSELNPTREDVLAFANRFGPLGTGVRISPADSGPDSETGDLLGEPLTEWIYHLVV